MINMKESETLIVDGIEVTLSMVAEGEPTEYRTRRNKKVRTRVGQKFAVSVNGNVVGFVERRMQVRESGPKWRRYVTARWYSPGWVWSIGENDPRPVEGYSKKDCVESLVWRARHV